MAIQKKSLITNLKATKNAFVAGSLAAGSAHPSMVAKPGMIAKPGTVSYTHLDVYKRQLWLPELLRTGDVRQPCW